MPSESDHLQSDGPPLTHWSDEHLIVIQKPTGLLSIPDGFDPTLPHLRSMLEPQYGRVWIVHRLDRDTSGLIVLARNAHAHRALNMQFEHSEVIKRYHALIDGCPSWNSRHIDLPLRSDGDRKHRTIVDPERGKGSKTDVEVIQIGDLCTLIEARPYTGRTHQIRVHLAAVGHPIVGDILYGFSSEHLSISRLALHASYLDFKHPITGEQLTFQIDDPPEFTSLLGGDPHTSSS